MLIPSRATHVELVQPNGRIAPTGTSHQNSNYSPVPAFIVSPRSSEVAKVVMQATIALVTALGRQWKRVARPLQVACVVFPALLACGLALIDYRVELQRTRDDVATTTAALAEHAQSVMETANLVLARVLDRIGNQDWTTLSTSPETHELLVRLQRELPPVEAVFLADPNGTVAASSRAYPMPRYDVHLAEYFATAKARNNDDLVITAPFQGTISGTKGFIISRRRVRDGKFDGIIGLTISHSYFETFYRTILTQPSESAAGLLRADGTVLVRFPDPLGRPAALPASHPIIAAVRAGRDFAVFDGPSNETGTQRIGGFRRLRDPPLLVAYAINRSVFLTTWGLHAAVIGVCAILMSMLLLATEHLVRRKVAIEHDALRRLVEETERRRQAEATAQQSQKMEALGRLTGGVAHDFNNLLSVILASLELALRSDRDPRSTRLLQTATKAAQRGAKLTAQMLTFSRKQEVALEPIDVNRLIHGMDDLLRRTLGPAVRLHYDLAEDLWPVLADVVQFELALLNLAVNARDAMPNGGDLTFRSRAVTISDADRRVPELGPGDCVCVQVADTGVGMSEEVRARAHEPFYTTKGPGSGTGLGLSTVYGFIRELGGALTFDSTPGVGTTVSLFLRKTDSAPIVAARSAAPPNLTVRRGRVLVVDDDDGVRIATRATLEELGHEVVDVSHGTAALDVLARDRRFDLLLLDFAMPAMNGSQLAAEITKLWTGAPILFMTGYVENDALRPWSALGYRTVRKPYSTHELAVAVEEAMRQAESVTG